MIGPYNQIHDLETDWDAMYQSNLSEMPVLWVSGKAKPPYSSTYLNKPSEFFANCTPYQSWTNLCDALKFLGENI